MVRVFGGKA
ncbi:hypothetical protein D027_0209A, partial [Vibrio parahaemolyticus 861]